MAVRAYLTEFIGTFFLVLTIGLVVSANDKGELPTLAPLAIGSSLMVMVYMGGHISGAHYNPAVSLAALVRGKLTARDFGPYLLAQVVGAIVAALTVYAVLGKTFTPAPSVDGWKALLVEMLYTFALALVVLNVATAPKTAGNSFYGVAIGFTVAAGIAACARVSGAAFNPAVGIGAILIDAVFANGTLKNLWIYLLGPLVGGGLAGLFFKYQNAITPERT